MLTFDPAPNFEAPTDSPPVNVYQVTVRATDESAVDDNARTGEFAVQVTVEGVDEPPEIRGDAAYTIAESGPKRVGGYTATDPEGAATTWPSLIGTDARHFTLDEFGDARASSRRPTSTARPTATAAPPTDVIVRASDEQQHASACSPSR